MESLREIFFKTDRMHSFDVRCWTFDVGRSSVSFSISLAAFQASGGADTLTPETIPNAFIL
jgi:hypothetical protein